MVSGPTSPAVRRLLQEEDDEIVVLLISIPDSDGPLATLADFIDERQLQ